MLARRARGAAALVVGVGWLLGGCAARPPVVLEIGPPGGGEPYLRRALAVGDALTYRFVHSVSRTPVEEVWAVVLDGGRPALRLRAVAYEATGAGLPSGPEVPKATFEATAEGFVLSGLDRPVGLPLDLRVSPEARNALRVGADTIDLTAFRTPGGEPAALLRLTLR